MKSLRTFFVVLFVLASTTLLMALSPIATPHNVGPASTSHARTLPLTLNEGPAPRPLCDPSVETCPSLPLPQATMAEGPAPRPLCDPSVETCPSLPLPQATIAEGPAPRPLCDPSVETCPSLPLPQLKTFFRA